jgi:hypothetical protein
MGIVSARRRRLSAPDPAGISNDTRPNSAVHASKIEFLSLYFTVRNATPVTF